MNRYAFHCGKTVLEALALGKTTPNEGQHLAQVEVSGRSIAHTYREA